MKGELSLQSSSWEVLPDAPAGINDLSVGKDGTIVVATTQGIYSYEAGAWQPIETVKYYSTVSAGDAQHIFAVVGSIPVHYYKTQDGWAVEPLAGSVEKISGASDGTVYGIDFSSTTVYAYDTMTSRRKTSISLDTISVGGRGIIYGTLNLQKSVFRIVGDEQLLIGSTLTQVSAGADGTVWGVDGLGGVYRMVTSADGTDWNLVDDAPALEQVSVGDQYQVVGLANNKVYRYQPEGDTPKALVSFQDADYGDLNMCATYAQMAYDMQPLEAGWAGSMGNGILKQLAGTSFTAQNFYYDYLTSTQAFMAYSASDSVIILAFRGTQELVDIFLDITAYPTPFKLDSSSFVSLLVYAEWQAIRDLVIADLKAVLQKIGGTSQLKSLYVTGHSLGAALATYATYDLLVSGAVAGMDSQKVCMINFASPPVGNNAFVKAYNALKIKSYRVLDPNDSIKWVAWVLSFQGFADVSQLVALPPGAGHPIGNYINLISQIYLKSRALSTRALLELTENKRDDG